MSGRSVIELRRVSKTFFHETGRTVHVLDGIDLAVPEHAFVSVVGPSGAGKTTILNLVAGFLPPTAGEVRYRGARTDRINTAIGYVTQESKLFPWLTLEGNVGFPLRARGVSRVERRRRVREQLELVGIGGFEAHYPNQLSGGMQKRAAIARTLIYEPEAIVMDEPFGSLDAQTRLVLQNELARLWERRPKTVLFVTHDLVEAITVSDLVVVLTKRPAGVKGLVEVRVPRPRDAFQIHRAEGFRETYDELWSLFQQELVVEAA